MLLDKGRWEGRVCVGVEGNVVFLGGRGVKEYDHKHSMLLLDGM